MTPTSARLRLDRRLSRRRGWISEKELEDALEALPDLSERFDWVDLPGTSPKATDSPAGDNED